ncbi:MAG TPA: hypothetical protein PK096_01980 [Candidatus Saccharibacteria bacterium]|nr:hypothetical protein [Candidatus Saccharibacteria bacterium]HRK94116.1 hypothetical protein [Candidatus Saccharibacteria bacterium]
MVNFDHPIVAEVVALNLPVQEETIITDGAAMVLNGIREEHEDGDIDIITCLENIQYLRNELGWRAVRMLVGYSSTGERREIISTRDVAERFDVHRWHFSMQRYNATNGKGRIYLPELGRMSVQDTKTGISVATPELIRLTKAGSDKPKDIEAIALIDQYLAA